MLEPVTFEFGSETHIEPDFKERCGRETHRSEFTGRKSPVNPIVPSFSIFQADYVSDVVNRCSIRNPCRGDALWVQHPVWVDSPQTIVCPMDFKYGICLGHVGEFVFLHFDAGRTIPVSEENRPVGG